jgi:predicted nucleic acid-binding protein
MLADIVIDTNVLMNASNPSEPRINESNSLLQELLTSNTCLVVDEGFNMDAALNRSLIGAEYIQKLRFGMVGYSVVTKLASSKRLKPVSRMAPRREQRIINQLIRNRRDRTFLSVSYNSTEKVLVSHDFTDFQIDKRNKIRQNLGVDIITASESIIRI